MKKIFVPTDFSESAENAFSLAMQMAKQSKATIHLVHGYNPSAELIASDFIVPFQGVPGTMSSEQINAYIEEQTKEVESSLAKLKSAAEKEEVPCETHIVPSAQFDALAEKAEELACDLVIMGSHGAKGVRETLLGSNAQKFVRNSKIPVLTIKKPISDFKVYNVAFASTFEHEGEERIYKAFTSLFAKHPVHTHFLFINTPQNFVDTPKAEERMKVFLNDTWPSSYSTHIYNDYTIEDGITNFSERHDIDLIVMATHGYHGLRKWVYHSTTEQLINHADRPVLSFRLDD